MEPDEVTMRWADGGEAQAEEWLDEWLPEELDWEYLVSTYTGPALVAAAAGGFLLGYRHGAEIVGAVVDHLGRRVAEMADQVLEEGTL